MITFNNSFMKTWNDIWNMKYKNIENMKHETWCSFLHLTQYFFRCFFETRTTKSEEKNFGKVK